MKWHYFFEFVYLLSWQIFKWNKLNFVSTPAGIRSYLEHRDDPDSTNKTYKNITLYDQINIQLVWTTSLQHSKQNSVIKRHTPEEYDI